MLFPRKFTHRLAQVIITPSLEMFTILTPTDRRMDSAQHRSASASVSAQDTNASANVIATNPEDQSCSQVDSQSENTTNGSPNQAMSTTTTTSGPSPIVYGYSPMFPQLHSVPFYASDLHPMANRSAQFPVGPQLQVPYVLCPVPMVWPYYFQQPMMPLVYMHPMPIGASPFITPQTAQHSGAGLGTSITNIVMYNEIGNDNHTSVKTHKKSNGKLVDSCPVNECLRLCTLSSSKHGPGLKILEVGSWQRSSEFAIRRVLYNRIYPLKNRSTLSMPDCGNSM
jgi:hypothetical protein